MTAIERFSIDSSLRALDAANAAVVRQRLGALREELARTTNRKYALRDDSRLAFLFCTDSLGAEWTQSEVVHELMSIQYISSNTPYVRMSQDVLRAVAHQLKEETKASWGDVWKTVSPLGSDALKYACMDASGVRIPQTEKRSWADLEEEEREDMVIVT